MHPNIRSQDDRSWKRNVKKIYSDLRLMDKRNQERE